MAKKPKVNKSKLPTYVVLKRKVETEECFSVKQILEPSLTIEYLEQQLKDGGFNLEQSVGVEPYVLVRALSGGVVAILEKDGGCGPDHKVEITVS